MTKTPITARQSIELMSDTLIAESLALLCVRHYRDGAERDTFNDGLDPMPAPDWDALKALHEGDPVTGAMVQTITRMAATIASAPQWQKRFLVFNRAIKLMQATLA